MLHALLQRKLEETISEPERLEDALTSTVFDLLVWMDEWNLIAEWFGLPNEIGSTTELPNEAWFWPRLSQAEPDMILRIGGVLVVVEAKYRSGRHDTISNEGEPALKDQLVRQYNSILAPRAQRTTYPQSLERAIQECVFTQVVIVDSRRLQRARREFRESYGRLPAGASLRLVTWQQLYRLLADGGAGRWAADLKAYLELAGLDTFDGFTGSGIDRIASVRLLVWRAEHSGGRYSTLPIRGPGIIATQRLLLWSVGGARDASPHSYFGRALGEVGAMTAIVHWRCGA